jgi:anthranilate synthase component 1
MPRPPIAPEFPAFAAAYEAGRPLVIWSTLVADLETPVSAMLKLGHGHANSFLLESVEGGAVRGRYSIVGLNPDLIWRCRGDVAEINRRASEDADAFEPANQGALASLRAVIDEARIELPAELPPMAAGLVGYLGYDMVRLMERLPEAKPDPLGLPDGLFLRPTIMAIFDSVLDIVTVVTPVRPRAGLDAATAYDEATVRIARVVADLDRPLPHPGAGEGPQQPAAAQQASMTREAFHTVVQRAKEYILAGDVFQVVPSLRFSVPFTLPPFALYRALRRTNPSPYMFFLDFGAFAVVGSSPEILVRLRDGKVTIRPLAGTRRRGRDNAEDRALETELLADEKERAEHLMLLDLGRNDVGRVAKIGTVRVTEQMAVERYSHVMHIVSNVEGKIDPKYDAMDALIAGFPAGTVTGAPKIRAMEIIDELETVKRGTYSGTVGYFSANGSMDTCIMLRTALVANGVMHVQAGAGIVADSDPESEYQECRNKAQALIRAAEEAVRYAARDGP